MPGVSALLFVVLACLATLPQQAFNSVVAIGRIMPDGSRVWIGSGFLYAYLNRPDLAGDLRYRGYIVTNRHVLESDRVVAVRFNPGSHSPSTAAEIVTVPLVDGNGKALWASHPDNSIDVGVIPFTPSREVIGRLKHMAYIIGEPAFDRAIMAQGSIASLRLKESGATEGDDVFIPGFPIGVITDQLFGASRNYPVLRRGTIAWVTPALEKLTPEFLVDALIFPGNSGSPVMRQCGAARAGDICLIGIVRGYLPYSDVANSRQTGRARVTFEENSDTKPK